MNIWSNPGDRDGKLGPWNTIKLDGLIFPGVSSYDDPGACPVIVKGASSFRVDRQKKKGGDGHRLVVEGYQPANVELVVSIWTQEQLDAYRAYLPLINPKFLKISAAKSETGKTLTQKQTLVKAAEQAASAAAAATASAAVKPFVATPKAIPAGSRSGTTSGILKSLGGSLGAAAVGATANPYAAAGLGAAEEVATNRTVHLLETPDLEMLDITRVYIIEIPTLGEGGVTQLRTATIKCIEVFGDDGKQKQASQVAKGADVNGARGPAVITEGIFNTGPRR